MPAKTFFPVLLAFGLVSFSQFAFLRANNGILREAAAASRSSRSQSFALGSSCRDSGLFRWKKAYSALSRLRGGGYLPSPWADLLETTEPVEYKGITWCDAMDEESQDWEFVVIFVPLENPRKKDLKVKLHKDRIYVEHTHPETKNKTVLCDRILHAAVVPDESYWDIEKNWFGKDGVRFVLKKDHRVYLWIAGFKEEFMAQHGEAYLKERYTDEPYYIDRPNTTVSKPEKRGYKKYDVFDAYS
mmetsp:Transcript_1784/g.3217  ORF Transcript_1784/g.3217 Transcript_1784/m.3217 type:complete len:244 (+) Transcript_1784:84-815(+)|eukprot:CAMPEP_0197520856 /NCGR_PEP_ID=MMETSP1318-20131121/6191_1 /TAXON_ID=552666 /ORGANISM="Partenskyella glossopodia, Strain RCC365" /LENGTH=243 /DNA_ID=CAMNT_0043072611 /DNA_START=51 /DNA_END=782 /DNA_ORIENTATION=-